MRTTLNIDDALARAARERARATGTTVTSLVEEGLRQVLAEEHAESPPAVVLPTYGRPGGRHVSTAEIREALEEPVDRTAGPRAGL